MNPSLDITNPLKFSGIWFTMHLIAFNANNLNEKKQCMNIIKLICNSLPCQTCRGHAKEYIKNNPMEEHVKNNDPLSLFIWTWTFHNTVNNRLGKNILSYEVAYHIYNNLKENQEKPEKKSVCSKECTDTDKKDVGTNLKDTKNKKKEDKNMKKGTLYMQDKPHYVYDNDKYKKGFNSNNKNFK